VSGKAPCAVAERVDVLGCALDRVTLDEAVAYCEEVIRARGFAQHMAVNAAKLVAMRDDADLRASVNRCELITADGQSIVWASRLLGSPLPCRVAGIDLMEALLARAAEAGYGVYILGATAEVLERAVQRMRVNHPGLVLAGYRDGYYADDEESEVAAEIAHARPDILFVAMSSPRKEYFLARHGRSIDAQIVMGVGGSIDVYAGLVQRAPLSWQRAGMEWLYRLIQEPRRLFKRYVKTNTAFLVLLGREVLRRRTVLGGKHPDL
jgi:N-acetylglucosaminyldiphosphoundecaprenol N-acetyl-beta-D-mannosaminyltransferase